MMNMTFIVANTVESFIVITKYAGSRGSNLLVAKLFYYTYLGVQKVFYEGC